MGDPETEVVIPRLKTDLVELFWLWPMKNSTKLIWKLTKVHYSYGCIRRISEDFEKEGNFRLETVKDSIVFHAGTKLDNGNVVSNGGRVLAVTSYGNDFEEAIKILQNIDKLHFEDVF
jgi:phosphoribosylamine--glycine ligase